MSNASSCDTLPGVGCVWGDCVNGVCACWDGFDADRVGWKFPVGSNCWLPTHVPTVLDALIGFATLSMSLYAILAISRQGLSLLAGMLCLAFVSNSIYLAIHFASGKTNGSWAVFFLNLTIILYANVATMSIFKLLSQFWKVSNVPENNMRHMLVVVQAVQAILFVGLGIAMIAFNSNDWTFNRLLSVWCMIVVFHLGFLSYLFIVPTRPIEAALAKVVAGAQSKSRGDASGTGGNSESTAPASPATGLLRKLRLYRRVAFFFPGVVLISFAALFLQLTTGWFPMGWVFWYIAQFTAPLVGWIHLVLLLRTSSGDAPTINIQSRHVSGLSNVGTVFDNDAANVPSDVPNPQLGSLQLEMDLEDTMATALFGKTWTINHNRSFKRFMESTPGRISYVFLILGVIIFNGLIFLGLVPSVFSLFVLFFDALLGYLVLLTLVRNVFAKLFWTQFFILRLITCLLGCVLGCLVVADIRGIVVVSLSLAQLMCFVGDALLMKNQFRLYITLATLLCTFGGYLIIQTNVVINAVNLIVVLEGFEADFSIYQLYRDALLAQAIFLFFELIFVLRGRSLKRFMHITETVRRDIITLNEVEAPPAQQLGSQADHSYNQQNEDFLQLEGKRPRRVDQMSQVEMQSGFLVAPVSVRLPAAPVQDLPSTSATGQVSRYVQHVSLRQSQAILFSVWGETEGSIRVFLAMEKWGAFLSWIISSAIAAVVLGFMIANPYVAPEWALWTLMGTVLQIGTEMSLRSQHLVLMLCKRTDFLLQGAFACLFLVAMILSFPDSRACLIFYIVAAYLSLLICDADLGDRRAILLQIKTVAAPVVIGCLLLALSLSTLIGVMTTSVETFVNFRPDFTQPNVSFLDSPSIWDIHQTSADLGVSISLNCALMSLRTAYSYRRGLLVFIRAPLIPLRRAKNRFTTAVTTESKAVQGTERNGSE